MKKAKFHDTFILVGGSCIGHYVQQDSVCKQCVIKKQCIEKKNNKTYPKSIKQAQLIIKKIRSNKHV